MPQQLPKDRPTPADKKREADLVKALEKEDFYGKKKVEKKPETKKPVIKVVKSFEMKVDRPTAADKKREGDLVKALEAEDFYGKKKPTGKIIPKAEADKIKKELMEKENQERVDKLAKDFVSKKRMESPLMRAAKSAKKQ
jgi:hypothetical protein